MKVQKNGKVLHMHPKVAAILLKKGIVKEFYETRDMADQPMLNKDPFDSMEEEELRAIAKERGLNVHHRAGADKIRAALRGA